MNRRKTARCCEECGSTDGQISWFRMQYLCGCCLNPDEQQDVTDYIRHESPMADMGRMPQTQIDRDGKGG
jgi:hypothetical protein